MDLIHKFLNLVLPPIIFCMILFLMPPILVFKFLRSIKRSLYIENVAGKVVLITGASSGIGEHLAYEYASRGARLALAARREDRLRAVADKALQLGSPDVITIRADIAKVEDCKRLVEESVNYFGQLDHLVNNAGIIQVGLFEDCSRISDPATLMITNFWGAVYCTHFAVPHLRKNKGRIIVISSTAGWLPVPNMSFYNASKAALINFYDTLRAEFGSEIGITIVTPGLIDSEMTHDDETRSKTGMGFVPAESTEGCAKAIVNSACRGERYLTEPSWVRVGFLFKIICPEVLEWCSHLVFVTRTSKKQA